MSERKFDLADAYAVRRRQASQKPETNNETIEEQLPELEMTDELSATEPEIEPEPQSRVQQIIKRMRSQGLR